MAIITISREAGSLSHEIAPVIAEKFDWFFIDKDKIKHSLAAHGINSEMFNKFDEKKPGLKDSFFLDNEKYFNYFKLYVFKKAVESKGCVILGRGGSFLFKDIPGVLRIRLIASEKLRIERTIEKLNVDEKEAHKIINLSDKERAGFHKYYYHEEWGMPGSYDITFNTDLLSTDMITNMLECIIETYLKDKYQEQGKDLLKNRYLAQRIIVKILYESNIPVRLLEVWVNNGVAHLQGTVEVETLIEECTKAAKIEGIDSVDNKIIFMSQYPPII